VTFPPPHRSRDRAIYAAVFAAALVPRVLYLLSARPAVENYQWGLASSLLTDGSLSLDGVKTTAFEPLYPLFLAASRLLAGDHFAPVRAIQCGVGALGAVLLYRLTTALTGRSRSGIIAASLYAVYPLLIRYAVDLSDTTLTATLLIGFAGAFLTADTARRSAAAGAWLGFVLLTRTMALPLVPLAAAIHWRDRGWRAAAALTATALLVAAPYMVRNHRANGALLPTRGGVNLFISNCDYTAAVLPQYGPDILVEYAVSVLDRLGGVSGPPSPARDRAEDEAYTRLALAHIAADPLGTLNLKLRNLWYFFSPMLTPSRDPTAPVVFHLDAQGRFTIEGGRPRPAIDHIAYAASYGPVLALALAGIWIRRRDLRGAAMLGSVVATFAIVHAVYFPTTRYRAPIDFVLLLYAAVALDRWLTRIRPSDEQSAPRVSNDIGPR
jgi:4-amino-4-deoxy-L-arabinose transferase-like glycosyltransferase